MENRSKSVGSHFVIVMAGTLVNLLIGLLTTPIITRLVDPGAYGQLSVFNMYVKLALMVFCVGLDQALVRFFYKHESVEYHRSILRKCLFPSLLITIIAEILFIVAMANGIVAFEFNLKITIILAVSIISEILNRFALLTVRLQYHSSNYSLIHIIHKILYVGLVFLLIWVFPNEHIFALTLSTLFAYVFCVVICIILERKVWFGSGKLPPNESDVGLRQLIKFGAPFILSMGITTVFQSMDRLSLNRYCSYSEVGIYSSAMSLVHVFAILQTTFNSIWAPAATEYYEKQSENRVFFQKGCSYITILMFAFGLGLMLVKDVFAILLGEKYREAAYVLPCLCFNPIMYTISEATGMGINFSKKSYLHIWTAVIACIINFIGNMILVPMYGGRGAAISTGAAYIAFFAAKTFISVKYFRVDYHVKRIAIITVAAFCFALYNTFVGFTVWTIYLFVICEALLVMIYRNDLKGLLCVCWKMIKRVLKK